jgi:inner membrane transporter RhtA
VVTAHVERTPRRVLPRAFAAVSARRALGSVPPPALVLAGIVSVQVGAALAKELFTVIGATGAVSLRLGFAAVVLLLIWRPSFRLDRRALVTVIAYGALLAAMNLTFYQAISRLPLGLAVTVEFLGPLTVALVGSRRWLDAVWAILAGGGVVLLTAGGGVISWSGLVFALLAALCWGLYIPMGAALGARTSGGGGLALGMTFGAVLAMPIGIVQSGAALFHPMALLAGLGVALLSSVVPYSVELEALRKIPPRVFGVLMSMEPAVAAIAGLIVLHQDLRPGQWAAIALVIAASVGATYTAPRTPSAPADITP